MHSSTETGLESFILEVVFGPVSLGDTEFDVVMETEHAWFISCESVSFGRRDEWNV